MNIEVELLGEHEVKSRELNIGLKDSKGGIKSFKTPAYFPTIARYGDLRDIMDAKVRLEQMGVPDNLPYIKGVVIEAHSIPTVLTKQLQLTQQMRLWSRDKGDGFANFYDYLHEYGLVFVVDPNLDRIQIAQTYGKDFQRLNQEYAELGKEFFTKDILNRMTKHEPIDARLFLNPDFITRVIKLQHRYMADVILPPYAEINLRTFTSDLATNLELFAATSQINKYIFKNEKPVIPVICLHNNVFKAKSGPTGRKEWDALIDAFVKLDADMIILKITNFNTSSKDESYREIFSFFKQLRAATTKPILFLNINEFAYVLLREGLDIYASRMSRSGMDVPIKPLERPPRHGKYYVPRKMELKKFEDIKELPCDCPFCTVYPKGAHRGLSANDWNSIRIYHFVYTKDKELELLMAEMKKNSLRAALRDIYADSENWKNFTEFI